MVLDCSATWEGIAEEEARLRTSIRRPSERASCTGWALLDVVPGMTISEQVIEFVAERQTSLVRLIAQSIMLVHSVQRYLLECQSIARKVAQVVPTHSVNVCLCDFIGKLRMVFGQEKIEVFVSNECSLLNDLRIDAW